MPPTTPQPAPSNNKSSVSIPLAIMFAGAMIAGAVYLGGRAPGAPLVGNGNLIGNTQKSDVKPVSDSDHILGSKDAPVVVIEYSDLECPFCKVFHSTMHQIVDVYQGKVAWVYRQFPIASLHSKAPKEAEASECAADQGGNAVFWKFIDQVFTTTGSNDTLDPAQLPKFASTLGLDVTKFNNCLVSGTHAKFITDSIAASIAAGAEGTPYSVIIGANGKKDVINGAQAFEKVRAQIDAVLK